ncbi:hypothetical protein KDA23_01365, partial [Candidatus Saccharibacteria bacterium]|nr:hypothetical protein [Candidatus Saccharibacteria bacterium]
MANDSSLAGGAVQFAFDLETQKGVMSLLAAIRASELAPIEKNELRDLVLLYTNGGRDNSVRITIQQKVLAHGIVPLVSPVPVPEVTGFGSSRPAPSFSVSARTTVAQSAPAAAPAPVTSTPAAPETPAPQVQPAPTPVSPSTSEAPVSTQAQAAVSSDLASAPAATPAPVAPT